MHFAEWAARGVPPDVIRRSVGGGDSIEHLNGQKELARSNLKRTWALSQRLRSGANSPVDYVNAVEAYLGGDDFTYTEAPPAKARTLEGFLFDAKTGYCQQYSGAMALLLRMQGIPARVATGFTSGSYDRRSKEYVVRDLDAHSWVEAWFPTYGWVTFDPTPSAAPPRSQSGDRAAGLPGDVPDLGGGGKLDPRAGTAATDEHAVGALHRRRRARRAAAGRWRRGRSCTAAATRARCSSSSARCGARGGCRTRARRCRRSRRRSTARPTPRATCARCASSATAAAATRRRAPSARACGASWGAGEGCAGGCARGGRCPRDACGQAPKLDTHG